MKVVVPPLLSSTPPPLEPLSVSPLLPWCPPISWDSSVCQQRCSQTAEEGKLHPEVSPRDDSSPGSCCLEAADQSHHRPSILKQQQQHIPNVTWPGALPLITSVALPEMPVSISRLVQRLHQITHLKLQCLPQWEGVVQLLHYAVR